MSSQDRDESTARRHRYEMGTGMGAPESGHGAAWQVRRGMQVFGPNDDDIGIVKRIQSDGFEVNRTFRKDIYVPFAAIASVDTDRVILKVKADELDDPSWHDKGAENGPAEHEDARH